MKRDEEPLRGRGGVADKCEVKAGLVVFVLGAPKFPFGDHVGFGR